MPKSVRLKLGTLEKLEDGRVQREFEERLEELVADIKSRPNLRKARQVSLVVKLAPGEVDRGEVETVNVEMSVTVKKPAFARVLPMKVGAHQQLLFAVDAEGVDPREKAEGDDA